MSPRQRAQYDIYQERDNYPVAHAAREAGEHLRTVNPSAKRPASAPEQHSYQDHQDYQTRRTYSPPANGPWR